MPMRDAQGYLAYVLHAIDLLEKTNVIAVDKPQQHLTEGKSNSKPVAKPLHGINPKMKVLLSTSLCGAFQPSLCK